MSDLVIEVEERTSLGKNESRRLRRSGLIPGVLYGSGKRNFPVTVNPRRVDQILNSEAGENTLLDLRLKGQDTQRKAMIREVQIDPVSGHVVHADFIRIEMDQKLQIQVPVRTVGVAPGVKDEGGILEVVQRTLEVECLPADIPEQVEVDVSTLHIGDQVRLADLDTGDRFHLMQAADTVVVTLVAPKAEEEEVAEGAEVEEGAEPEVIGKGKEDEAEGDQSKPKADS
jgi:large subunit ribosomal protein L25